MLKVANALATRSRQFIVIARALIALLATARLTRRGCSVHRHLQFLFGIVCGSDSYQYEHLLNCSLRQRLFEILYAIICASFMVTSSKRRFHLWHDIDMGNGILYWSKCNVALLHSRPRPVSSLRARLLTQTCCFKLF